MREGDVYVPDAARFMLGGFGGKGGLVVGDVDGADIEDVGDLGKGGSVRVSK